MPTKGLERGSDENVAGSYISQTLPLDIFLYARVPFIGISLKNNENHFNAAVETVDIKRQIICPVLELQTDSMIYFINLYFGPHLDN